MSNIQADLQLGLKVESSYGTGVTVDAFYEPTEVTLKKQVITKQGAGLRVGNATGRSDRRAVVKTDVGGDITVEVLDKTMGKLIKAAMGSSSSTNIAGSAYQQVFTIVGTDYLPSYTIQEGIPLLGGGVISPHTFVGMTCSGFEFSQSPEDIPMLTTHWVGKDMATATSLASPSYVSGSKLHSFPGVAITVGGSVTPPTTTAIATGGTAVTNVRDFSFAFDNNLDTNGWNFGSSGTRSRPPAVGLRAITGSFTAEFDAVTLRDAYLAQTGVPIVVTLTGPTAISGSDFPVFQLYLPEVKLDGEIPASNGGDVITQSIDFTVLYDGTNNPAQVVIVTAETAV